MKESEKEVVRRTCGRGTMAAAPVRPNEAAGMPAANDVVFEERRWA